MSNTFEKNRDENAYFQETKSRCKDDKNLQTKNKTREKQNELEKGNSWGK